MASIAYRAEQTRRPWVVRWRESGSNRSRGFRLKGEARAFKIEADAIEQAEREGRYQVSSALRNRTLEDYWPEFRASRSHLAKATLAKDDWVWRHWLQPHLGRRRLGTLTHHDLTKVLTAVTESGAGPDTRIAVYTKLNMILDDALGPAGHTCRQALAGGSKRKRQIRPLTDDELDRLIEAIPQQHRLLVETLATLGLRPQEALDITAGDVQSGSVTIRTTKRSSTPTRTLPLPESIRGRLESLALTKAADERLFHVSDYRSWRRRVFKPAAKSAGLDGIVPYDLRHSAVSKLIAAGATPTDVANWMGHDVSMTLKTYSHQFAGRKAELAAMLDRSRDPKPPG